MNFVYLTEIYENEDITSSNRKNFSLREIVINTSHVVAIRDDLRIKKKMTTHNLWPKDLDVRNEFTKISINFAGSQTSSHVTVVGAMSLVLEKIHGANNNGT